MKCFLRFLLCGVFLLPLWSPAWAAKITGVRSWSGDDSTRLVLELDGSNPYRVSEDSTPGRLIVTLPGATTSIEGPRWPANAGTISAVRFDTTGAQPRLIVDLASESEAKVFLLGPGGSYGHRLVIDLVPRQGVAATTVIPVSPASAPVAAPAPAPEKPRKAPRPAGKGRDIVVTIDPGHGGDDPGAIGPSGHYEKFVTLAIGRALAEYLNSQDGITARMTRDSDFFIPLQKRRQIGRYDHKADIFVSVHADSAPSRQARGASVFALSLKGANTATSRFAQMLAEQENKVDLIGGVVAESDDINNVLADMLVEGTLKHSLEMGRLILGELRPTVGKLHNSNVEQAGFAVLKEPGMVSLLVETGFISNPEEESLLTSPAYQRDVARAVGDGIVAFCRRFPVPGTYFDRN